VVDPPGCGVPHDETMRIPVRFPSRYPTPNFPTYFSTQSRNKNNVINIIANSSSANPRKEFVPSITLTNTMSLVPKIDEVIPFVEDNNTDLVFVTETWLTDLINSN
jgi:hypothetical protein